MTPSLAHRSARAAAGVALLLLAACGDGATDVPDETLPTTGTIGGSITGAPSIVDSTTRIRLGQRGPLTVSICGPAGTDFDLTVAGRQSWTTSTCESVTFAAEARQSYTVVVTAVRGTGAWTGCWAAGGTCTVTPPGGAASCAGTVPPDTVAGLPGGYYATARGRCGTELIAALHGIVRANHRVLGYTFARDSMYANIDDPDNDDVIEDLYLGRRAAGVNSRASALVADFNAEHAWPQSRGAQEDPAMSDLHHLFSADETANSRRSNNPFGTVTGAVVWSGGPGTDVSRLGYDAGGTLVFEPRPSRRGDVARALLYFYVRYRATPTASFSLANFDREEATLVRWAREDPPSAFERQRHDLVYRAQGNRNPFIDWPEFVTSIGDFPNS
jgi:deoxyribonuclease-1